jgi:hypothetical protein
MSTATIDKPAAATKPAAAKPAPQKFARVRVLKTGVRLRSCIYSARHSALVPDIPLADAEYKAAQGLIQIAEVYEA